MRDLCSTPCPSTPRTRSWPRSRPTSPTKPPRTTPRTRFGREPPRGPSFTSPARPSKATAPNGGRRREASFRLSPPTRAAVASAAAAHHILRHARAGTRWSPRRRARRRRRRHSRRVRATKTARETIGSRFRTRAASLGDGTLSFTTSSSAGRVPVLAANRGSRALLLRPLRSVRVGSQLVHRRNRTVDG